MKLTRTLPALLLSLLLFAACAPRASTTGDTALNSPAAQQTEETARVAYHRMEIGLLQTGEYTTNALLELELPQGVRWTLESFSANDYLLRFLSSEVSAYAWLVSPQGVRITPISVED